MKLGQGHTLVRVASTSVAASFSASSSVSAQRSVASRASRSASIRAGPSSETSWKIRGRVAAFSAAVLGTSFIIYSASHPIQLDAPDSSAAPSSPLSPARKLISAAEVAKHRSEDSCWVIVDGKVWDVTDFLERHPGGDEVLLAHSGKDASKIFKPIHPKGIIEKTLPPEAFIGFVDPDTLSLDVEGPSDDELRVAKARAEMPPVEAMVNLRDIEIEAEKVLSKTAWAYYASAGDDEFTKRENSYAYSRYWFRPRVLHKVGAPVDLSISLLGGAVTSRLPFFISPAAMAKLGHEEGERNLVRGAGAEGIVQGISINASCSLEEMIEVRKPGQPLLFQIYLNKDRDASAKLIKQVEEMGFNAIIFTVDSATPGKRELDIRAKPVLKAEDKKGGLNQGAGKGVAHAISGYQDPDMCWEDVSWIKSLTKLPVIVKGIQSADDVELAAKSGAAACVLSNHGGRSLDFSPAPIDILYELRQTKPELLDRPDFDVYIDGGVRRGTDIIKALCLGAKAVGLGRPFLYGNGTYGEEGVRRVVKILEEELNTSMRLLGVMSVQDLKPEHVRFMDRNPAPFAR